MFLPENLNSAMRSIPLQESEWSAKVENLKPQLTSFLSESIDDELLRSIVTGSLKELSLEGLPVTDQDLKILLSYCPLLEFCDLSECTLLTDEGINQLSLPNIKHLFLRGLPLLKGNFLDHLATFTNLETLDLSQTNLKFTNLHKLKHLNHLNVLYFWQCRQLKDQDLEWLREKNLKVLDVSYCTSLTDKCTSMLVGVKTIFLDGVNYISDKGLDPLIHSPQLEKISLYRCRRITETAIHSFPEKVIVEHQFSKH